MRVKVSRNSRRRGWTVRPVGAYRAPLVLPEVCLRDATFHVNERLRLHCGRTGMSGTYAWVEGEIAAMPRWTRWRRAVLAGDRFVDHDGPLDRAGFVRFGQHMEVLR